MPLKLQDDIGLFVQDTGKLKLKDDMNLFGPDKTKKKPSLDLTKIGLPMLGGMQLQTAKDLVSRTAGVAVGIANAPLAFVWGSQTEQYRNPKEWAKLSEIQKPFVAIGAG